MFKKILFIFLTAIINQCMSQQYRPGNCPYVEPIKDFDMKKFLGRWYAVHKTNRESLCMKYDFMEGPEGYVLELTSEQHRMFDVTTVVTYTGKVTVEESKMTIHFPLNFVGTVTFDVLTTDYKAYAGIHTCQKLFLFRSQSSILLSRTREMSEEILDAAKKEVQLNESLDFDSLQLRSAEQEMCFETDYRVLVKINPYLMSFQVERGVQPAENDEHAENQIS